MPNFKGFNTINQHKKFGITDYTLVVRDLTNAFMTKEGEMPGRPDLGTSIWSYVFEPNTSNTRDSIKREIKKIIKTDPRLQLNTIDLTWQDNTIIIELAVVISPNVNVETMYLIFDQQTGQLSIS